MHNSTHPIPTAIITELAPLTSCDPANPNGPKVREGAANLGFGDDDGRTLYITARTSLYAIRTNVTWAGAKR